jgi:POT family proton-dependent oligopeptide transporter
MDKAGLLSIYDLFGWIAVGIGVAVLAVSPFIKRLMHLDKLEDADELAGYKEVGGDRGQDAGMFPNRETTPDGPTQQTGGSGPNPGKR